MNHGEFLESIMNISLSFKCEPSSIAYKLEVFPNYDVDYINVSWEPYHYYALTITLLSANKK